MPILDLVQLDGYLRLDPEQCAEEGARRAVDYQEAMPFPHIVLDNFIDAAVLNRIDAAFPSREGHSYFDRAQERLKYQFDWNSIESGLTRNLLTELNSEPFIRFLENMTGIKGLMGDPHFLGGGLHETLVKGHLGVHADFNIHEIMNVERRLNLLIYLNDDWPEEYGGHLELWDTKMRAAAHRILPVRGRAVIFNTTLKSYHGQPVPLSCPPNRSRRSIATYYYSAFPREAPILRRTTTFKARPKTQDKPDWRISYNHFVSDWIPPRLQRIFGRLAR